jgi:hypothetical protein
MHHVSVLPAAWIYRIRPEFPNLSGQACGVPGLTILKLSPLRLKAMPRLKPPSAAHHTGTTNAAAILVGSMLANAVMETAFNRWPTPSRFRLRRVLGMFPRAQRRIRCCIHQPSDQVLGRMICSCSYRKAAVAGSNGLLTRIRLQMKKKSRNLGSAR